MNILNRKIVFIAVSTCITGCVPFADFSYLSFSDSGRPAWEVEQYDYGKLNSGSSSIQEFTYKNKGEKIATNCQSVVLSDPTNFSIVEDGCTSSTMQPNETCKVKIAAQPALEGVFNLQLSRKCKYDDVVVESVSDAKAISISASLNWSPKFKNFGEITVNSDSNEQVFTLSSKGLLYILNCSAPELSNTTDFIVTSDTCGSSDLGLNAQCQVTIKARPKSVGLKKATLIRQCTVGGIVSTDLEKLEVIGKAFDPCLGNESNSPFAFGDGTSGNPYGICTAAQLNNIGNNASYISSYFRLEKNLDLSSYSGNSFNLIATQATPFTGVFDGNDKTISNLTYSLASPAGDFLGLFRRVGSTGIVKNLTVSNFTITAGNYVGLLVGENVGVIDNCHSSGSITGLTRTGGLIGRFWKTDSTTVVRNSSSTAVVNGSNFVGGLIGWVRGEVNNSFHTSGNVTGSGDRIGGLVGSGDQANIINSYAEGTVSGRDIVGGIVGIISPEVTGSHFIGTVICRNWCGGITSTFGAGSGSNKISKSYAEVTLTTTGYAVGGITGYTYANYNVENSYALVSISSTGDGLGGLVGYSLGSIVNSYAVPSSIGGVSVERGGLRGDPLSGTISNSFWNKLLDLSIPDTAGSKTTVDMQSASTYTGAGWDTTIWDIRDGFYPKLK